MSFPRSPAPVGLDGRRRLWLVSGFAAAVLHLVAATAALEGRHVPALPPVPPAVPIELSPLAETKPEPAPPPVPPSPQVAPPPVAPVVKSPPRRPRAPAAPHRVETAAAPPAAAEAPAETAAPSPAKPPAPAPAPAAPATPPENAAAATTWQASVVGRLERFKRYPPGALARRQQGLAVIRIVIDRDGKVLSTRMERGSGNSALDEESLALPDRAQPLPPPPAEVKGEVVELVVPVQFLLR